MKPVKNHGFFIVLILLITALMPSGCGSDSSVDYYLVKNAPTVRITGEALEILLESSEPHTLTYTVRTS